MTTSTEAPILRLRGIEMAFGGVTALRGVDLDITQGERLGVLGPNGAGKTTLFNIVAGDFAPTKGTVELNGINVSTAPARARPAMGLSRTYQRTRLFPGLSVADNLFVAVVGKDGGRQRMISRSSDNAIQERAADAANAVWLGGKLNTLVADLSHGEQRQLEVGMALAAEPAVMLLDEPASGLSRGERERLVELLKGLPSEVTLVLIEHDMDVALNVALRLVVMHEGQVVAEGTPTEIRANEMVHDIYLGKVGLDG